MLVQTRGLGGSNEKLVECLFSMTPLPEQAAQVDAVEVRLELGDTGL